MEYYGQASHHDTGFSNGGADETDASSLHRWGAVGRAPGLIHEACKQISLDHGGSLVIASETALACIATVSPEISCPSLVIRQTWCDDFGP
jgi:hypothetical protein